MGRPARPYGCLTFPSNICRRMPLFFRIGRVKAGDFRMKKCKKRIKSADIRIFYLIGASYVGLDDPQGGRIELVDVPGEGERLAFGGVSPDVAIKGGRAEAWPCIQAPRQTADVLTKVMGLEPIAPEGDYSRFISSADIGNVIGLKTVAGRRGSMGAGTVHHVAWRETDVKARHYLEAIYFPEPGGTLFEIAAAPPGFTVDETAGTLGERLMLPVIHVRPLENRACRKMS